MNVRGIEYKWDLLSTVDYAYTNVTTTRLRLANFWQGPFVQVPVRRRLQCSPCRNPWTYQVWICLARASILSAFKIPIKWWENGQIKPLSSLRSCRLRLTALRRSWSTRSTTAWFPLWSLLGTRRSWTSRTGLVLSANDAWGTSSELIPKRSLLFGFPPKTKWDSPALSNYKVFLEKGVKLIRAIDMSVVFLGPDLDPLKEELYRLGWQHTAMKALPQHWPIVGEAPVIGGFLETSETRGWR